MDIKSKLSEIKTFLSISEKKFDLDKVIYEFPDEIRLPLLDKVSNFITNFNMFKNIKPFMNSVYICVKKTLEIKADIQDYEELLIKNSLMRFIQEYIAYSNLSQKEEVLNFLSQSLEKLQLQPLIINLGLLLKPMYSDQDYLDKIKDYEEIEVTYILNDENELKIKKEIDRWLKSQEISIDHQDDLKNLLIAEYEELASKYNLSKGSKAFDKLLKEVNEMLAMKLTVLSLMDSMEDSFEPVPINK